MATSHKRLSPSQRMRVAYLLTLVGGFLDAYTYCIRGGVFANAQTGNIVKLGMALVSGDIGESVFFVIPILAFVAGLFTALGITEALERHDRRLARRIVLLVEAAALGVVCAIPLEREQDILANCIVSFVAAMQYETFTTFRGDPIATTMSTGNLRKFVDHLHAGTINHKPGELLQAARFLSIIVTFCGGACIGAWACDALGCFALAVPICLLLLAVVVITALHSRSGR